MVQVAFEPRRLRRSVVTILTLVSLWLALIWLFQVFGHFLFLLLLAWLLAIALEPPIAWLSAHGLSRGWATTLGGGSLILMGFALAAIFGTAFVNQLGQLITLVPTLVTNAVSWVNGTFKVSLDAVQIRDKLNIQPDQISSAVSSLGSGVLGWVGSLVAVLFDLTVILVFMFYFAGAGPRLLSAMAVWLPPERQRVMGTVWEITARKTGGYVISKAALALASAIFHGIFFWAIGVPSWLPLALLVGITAQFVPVVGTYLGIVIPLLVAVLDQPINGLWILAFATVYQQIETYVFTPKISRRTMDVHPAIALASVFLGIAVWGPLGALIGIPIAAAVVAIFEEYGRRYEVLPGLLDLR